ncbi:TauD/TfdA family dioxygenase [Kitasatospora sp. NPDC092039]|uniref:TauD/TfdA family dioxygenase n=1 Tax=Kitasatospora sp. NPDC092039 TaxID=3364086 RepID=UPI00380F350A
MPTASPPVSVLAPPAARRLVDAAERLLARHGAPDSPELLAELPRAARELPESLVAAVRRGFPVEGMYVLRGLPVADHPLEPTPLGWRQAGDAGARWDVVLLLLASVLGHPLAWEGQQNGRTVHNIVPSPGHEEQQTGASSAVLLAPHTEDAFHPGRADVLMLCCLRNPDRVSTTAASVRSTDLSAEDVAALTRPTVPILPDDAYTVRSARPPVPVRTLWRTPEGLGIRFDPAYTRRDGADPVFRGAYARLEAELERVTQAVVLEPGDVLVVDNDVVVHGRVPFRARYDGTDRWLKRTLVRLPHRTGRPASERAEHGYGQAVVDRCCPDGVRRSGGSPALSGARDD